jgi:hypothetical protein
MDSRIRIYARTRRCRVHRMPYDDLPLLEDVSKQVGHLREGKVGAN